MRELTPAELARLDGVAGRPACFAYDGLVYDVTASFLWRGGRHQVLHRAGRDLSGSLAGAPHGADLFARVPVVGSLRRAAG